MDDFKNPDGWEMKKLQQLLRTPRRNKGDEITRWINRDGCFVRGGEARTQRIMVVAERKGVDLVKEEAQLGGFAGRCKSVAAEREETRAVGRQMVSMRRWQETYEKAAKEKKDMEIGEEEEAELLFQP